MLKYVRQEWVYIIPGVVLIIAGSLVDIVVPYYVGEVIDAMSN